MKLFLKLLSLAFLFVFFCVMMIVVADSMVKKAGEGKVFDDVNDIPENKVGLLLGVGKYLTNGHVNLYYKYRIDAAVKLFNAGKVEQILVSGDNSRKDYDEPTTIKEDLIARGIPANRIHLDYAGFRTFDSVIRCKEIFGQEKITVISQKFHNERAIYIAKRKGIDAIGFNANDVSAPYGFKTMQRERLARVKMMLDLVFGKKPKYLGDKIEL